METKPAAVAESWHLDKKVPLALIFAILVQTASAIWWAGKIDGRVDQTARDIATLEKRFDREQEMDRRAFDEIKNALRRIEDKLDGKQDRGPLPR